MKYLIINGSPHKGNTWKLAEMVKTNLLNQDINTEFNEIHMAQLQLPFCVGCSNCFRLGGETCPHDDKMSVVIKGIEDADGVIIVSTTYNRRETALLKNLFDHLCYMLHRPHFFTSKALVITTTGGVGGRAAAKSIASMLQGIGFNRCYRFSTASYSWNAYEPRTKTINKLSKITAKFQKEVASKQLHSPSILQLIPYNIFRGMSLAYTKGSQYETEDGRHWTTEERKKKVYDPSVRVSFYKKPFGQLFYMIGKKAGKMKRVQVSYKK